MTGDSSGSLYSRLLERYADAADWPVSRKMVLLTAILVPYHVAASVSVHLMLRRMPTLVDLELYDRVAILGFVVATALWLISWLAARHGAEGRWTVHLLIVLFGGWIALLIHIFGTSSSAMLSWYPLVLVLIGLYFDEWTARWGLAYGLVLLTALETLELSGRLPFAPALLDRSLDAQLAPPYVAAMYVYVLAVFFFCFSLAQFSVATRKLQKRRLEAAHHALAQTSSELARANEIVSRYVASQLADKIRAGDYEEVEKHERRKLTLFFSDIKDFTPMADRLEPEDLSTLLNEYLSEMSAIARRYGGTIDKFVGDAMMILFGAPARMTDRDQAVCAVHMAIEMQERLVALREKWHRAGVEFDVTVRMGINTGQATIGNFGSKERMDYTAIGRQVNLAARLQVHCSPGEILLSHSTYVLIEDEIPCLPKGVIQVKGLDHPVRVYEVVRG